jgi:hypothetical protein
MSSKKDLELAQTATPDGEKIAEPGAPLSPSPVFDPAGVTAPPSLVPPADRPSPSPAASPTSPLEKWERYELLGTLGSGGMGTVYRARDRRLDRTVALKFILGANPNLAMRFLQEARAQARIDHPNVCRVYEVGEVEGRPYIAMQLIDGEQLGKAGEHMSLDERVTVVRDVALAIHEAHKLGIVHRDVKPANILVERGEDRHWFPVVMDFGLAREATTSVGITESGALLGTPAYMSPEQARGDLHAVDRRADIYSLGATFYELLTGRPPFSNPSLALALDQVLNAEPPNPRSLAPHLPIDLETIALKCLAKEPERRYASARALADDLSRYLDGEPIVGRRPSLWQRLRLRARRNRALVAVSASSLAVILVVAGLGVRTWIGSRRERARAAERAHLAERLGQDAKEIEWLLRAADQLPLHDTTPEREVIRARMRRIAATKHDLGALGDATIHDALGRGHLALREWKEAADELARAADAGLDTVSLHAARGRVLGELYHRAVEDARRSGDRAWLAARDRELQARYLTPALAELEKTRDGGDAGESPAALEALLAFYRRDYPLAEKRALESVARTPWLFEARKVAADATYAAAVAQVDHGSYDAARPGLERATTLYADAADAARSNASIYEAAAEAWLERAEVDVRQGRSAKDALEHALEVVDKALTADPNDAPAYTTKAYVLLRWYRTPALRSGDQRVFLEKLAAAAARATEIDPLDANAWDALGNAHVYRGIFEMRHSGDPSEWWQHALAELGKALTIRPNHPWANNDIGVLHRWLGTRLVESGADPTAEYRAALADYERAATIDPDYLYARNNQTDVETRIAEYQVAHGLDPSETVAGARRFGERCLAINPSFSAVLDLMAQAELSLVQYLVDRGADPAKPLADARNYLTRAIAGNAANPRAWFFRLVAAHEEARYRLRSHLDPSARLAEARAALAETLRLDGACAECYEQSARGELLQAEAVPASAGALLTRALADVDRAASIDPRLATAKEVAAEACVLIADLRRGERARASIVAGLAYAGAALALNPELAGAHAAKAALLLRQSELAGDQAAPRREALKAARVEATRAFEINPLSRGEWAPRLTRLGATERVP